MTRSSRRSFAWKLFDLSSDKKFVQCRVCKKSFKYCSNTSNLLQHAGRQHPVQYQAKKLESALEGSNNFTSEDASSSREPSDCPEPKTQGRKYKVLCCGSECNSNCNHSSDVNPKTEDIFIEFEAIDDTESIGNMWQPDPLVNTNTNTNSSCQQDKLKKNDLTSTLESMKEVITCFKTNKSKNDDTKSSSTKDGDALFGDIIAEFLKNKKNSKRKNAFKKQIFAAMMDYSDSD